jgi:hypothetical protein
MAVASFARYCGKKKMKTSCHGPRSAGIKQDSRARTACVFCRQPRKSVFVYMSAAHLSLLLSHIPSLFYSAVVAAKMPRTGRPHCLLSLPLSSYLWGRTPCTKSELFVLGCCRSSISTDKSNTTVFSLLPHPTLAGL